MQLKLVVNSEPRHIDVAPGTLLVEAIRGPLGLTGTHVGCDTAQCGACTVLVDGRAVKSCNSLAVQHAGCAVDTVEGLARGGELHPLQTAFSRAHALQCGFCTPGMLMSCVDLCERHPHASPEEVGELLEGNLCRCTGYQNIVRAVTSVMRQVPVEDAARA
ncbi:MAG: (2Fe-2S)-binding protein [Comamonadaceae bacterium]|nr:MAG: (2Fe-2S)-binding protein [Comamonadaceae bacterium]